MSPSCKAFSNSVLSKSPLQGNKICQNSKVFRLYFDRISDTVFAAVTAVTFQQIKINTASFQIFADIKGKLVNAFGILVKKSWSFIKNDPRCPA